MSAIEDILKREEGFVPYAYRDHLGYLTIGYGTMIDERKGGGITEEQGLYLLKDRIKKIQEELRQRIPWYRMQSPVRRAVLEAMAYQMGVSGLLSFRRTLQYVKDRDYKKAAAGMRASRWAQQTPGRAERMAKAMEGNRLT